MLVPVMDVRIVRVRVHEWFVGVLMRVGLASIPFVALMLVVLVVHVRMRVFQVLVHVFMLMALRDMQPNAPHHQYTRDDQLPGDCVMFDQ